MVGRRRPVFLNLLRVRMPITAVLSILHRVSGVLMVLAIPLLIRLWGESLSSPAGYAAVQQLLRSPFARIGEVLLVWALAHHLLAGIRFLLIDLDVGVHIEPARRSARLVNIAGLVAAAVFIGYLIQ